MKYSAAYEAGSGEFVMETAVTVLIDKYGVTERTRQFLLAPKKQYINGAIGKDMDPEQLEHFLETKVVWIQL